MQLTDYNQPTPLVSQTLAHRKPGHVLDIGAYAGRNALYLARLGWEVTAIDTDKEVLAHLQAIADQEGLTVHTIVIDVCDYIPTTHFDAILALMILHFLPDYEIDPVIEKMQQWTNEGGINIVTAFTAENPVGTRPYLFPVDGLKESYGDWSMKQYEESCTSWVVPDGKVNPERYMAARLVAQK